MKNIRQSCGMPMAKDSDFGTEKDEKKCLEYCVYCFEPPSPKGEGFSFHSSEQPRQLHEL